ncbi:MAG: hypothetical protein RLZZ490_1832 [Cyanobacteriota bacterium]|jgi:hypothetical protein
MALITIEIPDELAQRLAPFESNLSELLAQLLTPSQPELTPPQSSGDRNGLYQEILDFLISQPSPDQILHFKVSDDRQSRLAALLVKNQDSGLTSAESSELDLYEQLDTLVGLLRVRAYESLKAVHPPQV